MRETQKRRWNLGDWLFHEGKQLLVMTFQEESVLRWTRELNVSKSHEKTMNVYEFGTENILKFLFFLYNFAYEVLHKA